MQTIRSRLARGLGLALILGLFGLVPPAAAAPPGLGPGNGTTCFPGTVNTTFGYTTRHNCTTESATADGGVAVTFTAHVAAPSVAPAVTQRLSGFLCQTSRGLATVSVATVTPEGEVSGTCTRRP